MAKPLSDSEFGKVIEEFREDNGSNTVLKIVAKDLRKSAKDFEKDREMGCRTMFLAVADMVDSLAKAVAEYERDG